jgi:tRNA (adenine57-N1/adenine58-N1)-methyltransferase catalytic subunit
MHETLIRPHEVSAVPAPLPIGDIAEKLRRSEIKREEKRLQQIEAGRGVSITAKRKREEEVNETDETSLDEVPSKRVKTEDANGRDDITEAVVVETDPSTDDRLAFSRVLPEVRGHTSYLTFACLLPHVPRVGASEPEVAVGVEASESTAPALN